MTDLSETSPYPTLGEIYWEFEHHNEYPKAHAKLRPEWCVVCTNILEREAMNGKINQILLFLVFFGLIIILGLLMNKFAEVIFAVIGVK